MWEKIFTVEALQTMIDLSEETEDFKTLEKFVEKIIINNDYRVVVVLATQWESLKEDKQVSIAVNSVGENDASRFMILLDFLADKFKKGELQ